MIEIGVRSARAHHMHRRSDDPIEDVTIAATAAVHNLPPVANAIPSPEPSDSNTDCAYGVADWQQPKSKSEARNKPLI